jgi:hypothetical protein
MVRWESAPNRDPLVMRPRHDADCQPVGVRHIRGRERDARPLQPEQEVRIASAAIKLCDDQSRLPYTTFAQRSPKLWTTISLATLDLDELRERRRAEAGQVGGEGCTLRLDAKT